jgi:hypothetical protein
MLLLLSSCAVAPISAPSSPDVIPSPGSARVAGAPVQRTPPPDPTGEIMLATSSVTINMDQGAEGLVVDIYSETGIGEANILLPMLATSTPVKLRLHLRGLEGWTFTFDDLATHGAVATSNNNVLIESFQIANEPDTPIDSTHPHWMDVTHIKDTSATSGYFELLLPSAFLESGLNTFTISWVDFYR